MKKINSFKTKFAGKQLTKQTAKRVMGGLRAGCDCDNYDCDGGGAAGCYAKCCGIAL